MNIAVVQQEALPVLDEAGIGYQQKAAGLYAVDAIELAAGLCCSAVRAGTVAW